MNNIENKNLNLCQHFGICGGCSLLKTDYNYQLRLKESLVKKLFTDHPKSKIHPILPSPSELDYRHKLQLPFGRKKVGRKILITLGLHSLDHSFIVDQAECRIQDQGLTKAAQAVRQWARKENLSAYNEKSGSGLLRHLLIRKSMETNEILLAIVINHNNLPNEKELSKSLFMYLRSALGKKSDYGKLVGILQNTNVKQTNMVLGKDTRLLWGRPYFLEKIGKWKFKVGIGNFIQVNPYQTENLYTVIKNHINPRDRIIDAYAGMGTIGIWLSEIASQVICTEENPDSYRSGIEAIKVNKIHNLQFIKGRSEEILPELLHRKDIDVLVVDPPRVGLEDTTINAILNSPPPKFIYVSCDPQTLKRDLNKLKSIFNLTDLYPVDLFPQTDHLEIVAILTLKK